MRNQTIKEAFVQTQARLDKKTRIDSVFSGTTCCQVFMDKNTLLSANAGDSRAILVREVPPRAKGLRPEYMPV